MATITQILSDETTSSEEKLELLQEVVAKARKEYGNTDLEITTPSINTTTGVTDLKYLSVEDKLAVASTEVSNISQHVIALSDTEEGVVFDKEVARGIALNPILCNLGASVDSEYL